MVQLKTIYFATYALIYTFYGSAVTAIGPIIIYFSHCTNEDQTYFSFIFFARAIGYLIGGSLIKYLTKVTSCHRLLAILIVTCGVSLIVSSFSFSFLNLSITLLIAGATCCMMSILTNLCIFQIFFNDRQDYWIQLLNLFFGIGGLIGPAFVIYFQEKALRALGISIFVGLIPILLLKTPEGLRSASNQQQRNKKLQLPRSAQICICLLFLLYIAEEVGYAGWIPTYAFKAGVANQTQASALASIFWIVNTVSRLLLLYMPGTVAQRLRLLLKLLLISTFIVLVCQWMGFLAFVSYAGVISSGFFLSAMYALFFSMAQQHGYGLSTQNTANFSMCASLGEGLLVMPIGYAMGLFGYKALIYIIFLFSAIMFGVFTTANDVLEKDSQKQKEMLTPLKQLQTLQTI